MLTSEINMFQAYLGGLFQMAPMMALLPVGILFVLGALLYMVDRKGAAEPEQPAAPPALEQAIAAAAEQPAPLGAATPRKRRLLVVDDSAVVRVKLRRLFEERGYEVALAEDGEQALVSIEGSAPFNVVITDLEMPKMDGFALIAAIQGGLATEDLPIIAITGHEDLQARVRDCQGLFGIYRKPWVDRDLIKRVDALCGLSSNRTPA